MSRAPGMRLHPRTRKVERATARLREVLITYQVDHKLTDIEMLQAVAAWQATHTKYMLRAERHPQDPDQPADVE